MRVSPLLVAAILALGLAPRLIEPPFVRKWTQLVGDQAFVVAVRDGAIYYGSKKGLGALDLATGQRRWSGLASQWIAAAVIQGSTLYAISQGEKADTLTAVDITSRQSRTLASLARGTRQLAVDAGHVYLLDGSATLRAFDPNSGAVIWTRALQPGGTRRILLAQLESTADGLYVGLDEAGEFGVDPKDGRILWSHPSQYAGLYRPIVIGGDVITQHEGLKRTSVRSGKVVWKAGEGDDDAVLVANVLVSRSAKVLLGRDATTGRLLWRLPLRDPGVSYSGADAAPVISDGESVWMFRRPVLCVTKDGRERWNRSEPFTGIPAYADGERVITTDGERILAYGAGTLPPLPTADTKKRSLAERLASRFEILDDAERGQLRELAPFTFRPLLTRYVEWAKAWDAKPGDESSFDLYRLLTNATPLLYATCRKEDTRAIVTAWSSLGEKSSWRGALEQILQAKGEPAGYVPILVEHLRRLPPQERQQSAALSAVSHSSHPAAVAFMLAALRDPKAAEAWRQEAFQHLAGTGGAAGVQAVRTARPRRDARKPWWERIDLAGIEQHASLGTKTDASGGTWMLFHSPILGNYSDLFAVQKLGSKWGKPLFTGAWTGRTFHSEAPKAFREIPIDKLVSTQWIRIFPGDAAIRRDSDGDGLTDVVEARLGTDPHKADTDDDGLADAIDPCPSAAPRPLGDTEKIIAACLEARFFQQDWGTPAILAVEGVKPFELYGYPQTVMWQATKRPSPLGELYGGGVNMIGFHQPEMEGARKPGFIQYGPDHRTAHTIISRYSGGLNGDGIEVTLKKIGDAWFVVDLQMRYVS